MRKIEDSMEPYDGADPNTSSKRKCSNCCKDESQVNLKLCSRCKLLKYCNPECQKEHFKDHKAICLEIRALTQLFDAETQEMQQLAEWGFGLIDEPENVLETQVGNFWFIYETRNYIRARFNLSKALYSIAYGEECVEIWEKVLGHQLEIMRLNRSDNLGVRFGAVFVMLYLNRDDDCYAFMRHFLDNDVREADEENLPDLVSRPGDWIYGKEPDCRFGDMIADLRLNPKFMPLAFLVALLIIKMRIVAQYEARKKTFSIFASTKKARQLGGSADILQIIKKHLIGDAEAVARIGKQNRHVDQLMEIIHRNNPTMLPSIINPGPLKSQPQPHSYTRGSPEEAWFVLDECNRCFLRTPGAEARVAAKVGVEPNYRTSCEGYGF